MRNKLLAVMMFSAAMLQVACDDNKSPQQTASDCLAQPTCVQQVRAASGGVLYPLGTPTTTATTALAQVPVTAMPGATIVSSATPTTGAFKSSEAINALVQQKSAKVAAAILADDNNPNSPNWKIPNANPVKASDTSVPQTVSASNSRDPASSASSAGDGEASR